MTKVRSKLWCLAAALVLSGQPVLAHAEPVTASIVGQALPEVTGPIPVTAESRPLVAPLAPLTEASYVEEEYFLTGLASTYDWVGKGHAVTRIAGPGKYVTRILVRRPRDPASFGGNVEVTVFNSSTSGDFGAPNDFARTMQQGDVWIGISTKPVAAKAMQRFDPVRYASLDWSNPAPPDQRCEQPTLIPIYMIGKDNFEAMTKAGMKSSWPDTEDGLVWDMLGQLGLLLKSDQRAKILPGFGKPTVYMTGISLSGIYIRTWVAGFHDLYRTANGEPVYDGYLPIVGAAMARINQCAADVPLDDPTQKLTPPDVPFLSISSEGEMWQSRHTRQPDVFTATGGIVSYEVAGGSHRAGDVAGPSQYDTSQAGMMDMMKASGATPPATPPDTSKQASAKGPAPNDFIWQPLVRGANRNLQLWMHDGIRPPQVVGISVDAALEILRDQHGNAIGGLRMPYIEAPIATYTGFLATSGIGSVTGTKVSFSPDTLKALYPNADSYRVQFSAATDRLLKDRWISSEDASAINETMSAEALAVLEGQ